MKKLEYQEVVDVILLTSNNNYRELLKQAKELNVKNLIINIEDSIEKNWSFVPEILEFILREFKFRMSNILSSM